MAHYVLLDMHNFVINLFYYTANGMGKYLPYKAIRSCMNIVSGKCYVALIIMGKSVANTRNAYFVIVITGLWREFSVYNI